MDNEKWSSTWDAYAMTLDKTSTGDAIFTQIGRELQEEIITGTEHSL